MFFVNPFATALQKELAAHMVKNIIKDYTEEIKLYIITPLTNLINAIGRLVLNIFRWIKECFTSEERKPYHCEAHLFDNHSLKHIHKGTGK